MEVFTDMTLLEWIIMVVVLSAIGVAFWVINDARRRGAQIGGRACGGCPHYCQINRNCDGTEKEGVSDGSDKEDQ